MRGPYGFEIAESCLTSTLSANGFYRKLSPAALRDFDAIQSPSVYPRGALLFMEKQEARGIFTVLEGQVKISLSSREGKMLILRIAKPGEVLGLTAVLEERCYEATAETCCPCQIAYVSRDDFLCFVARHPEVYPAIVTQLSGNYRAACEQLRNIGLSGSTPERLGRLLLDLSEGSKETRLGNQFTLHLSHGEIGELIGVSRETVARTFSYFRNCRLVELRGTSLTICNRAALENLVAGIDAPDS